MNILVTGGASGLGEAITRTLSEVSGNKVFFTYSKSKEKAEKIIAQYNNSVAIKCDFSLASDLQALTHKLLEMDIDVLVNNAYASQINERHFHKIAADDFLQDFQRNIIPTIEITQAAIKVFRKKKKGKIITILTSFLVNVPPIGLSIYLANKAYIEKLTKVWAHEYSKFNIVSNSVSPSFMQTGLTSEVDERIIEQMITNHPLKRLVSVAEVAESVLFLTTASSHINGIDLLMNAGNNIK